MVKCKCRKEEAFDLTTPKLVLSCPHCEGFGVLQPLWDAWKDADFDDTMDAEYYKKVLWHQVWELDQESEQGRLWDEWIDVICVALNYLRMTSITPKNIGKAAEKRAIRRYNGKTKEIQEKYKEMENGDA
jgi:epoxyqueuosine reductase QueG